MKRSACIGRLLTLAVFLCLAARASANQYTAFSLKVAQQRIEKAGENWRQTEPEVLNLGGINKVEGFVYDTATMDLILVGDHESDRATLTLDDLVVALRARFRYNEWPLVSIDPTPETKTTQMQHVRFEGGIENTAFGQAMYDADYRLKQMGMGLVETGIVGLKTYWDRSVEETETGTNAGQHEVGSRFWFYPINPHVVVREDVCVVRGLKVGVFTEVLSAKIAGKPVEDVKAFKDATGDAFASGVSQRFDDLCKTQPSYNRLRGLQELVAVSKALEELEDRPDLAWWLEKYPLATVETPQQTKALERKYEGARCGFTVSGGVHLTALAMRLKAGDVKALREAVLGVRPAHEVLSWQFVSGEWLVPLTPGQMRPEDVAPLFGQVLFLEEQTRFADELNACDLVLALAPHLVAAWYCKAYAFYSLGRYAEALQCWDRTLSIAANAEVLNSKGVTLSEMHRDSEAVECFNQSLALDRDRWATWYNKAFSLAALGYSGEALSCCDSAVARSPDSPKPLHAKGELLCFMRQFRAAIRCFDDALTINHRDPALLDAKARALLEIGYHPEALNCCDSALEINPGLAAAWRDKGELLCLVQRFRAAIRCFDNALVINHRDPALLDAKARALLEIGSYDEALRCCNSALDIDNNLAAAWRDKGLVLLATGSFFDALTCLDRALKINPHDAGALYGKGRVLHLLGDYTNAAYYLEMAESAGESRAGEFFRRLYLSGY